MFSMVRDQKLDVMSKRHPKKTELVSHTTFSKRNKIPIHYTTRKKIKKMPEMIKNVCDRQEFSVFFFILCHIL